MLPYEQLTSSKKVTRHSLSQQSCRIMKTRPGGSMMRAGLSVLKGHSQSAFAARPLLWLASVFSEFHPTQSTRCSCSFLWCFVLDLELNANPPVGQCAYRSQCLCSVFRYRRTLTIVPAYRLLHLAPLSPPHRSAPMQVFCTVFSSAPELEQRLSRHFLCRARFPGAARTPQRAQISTLHLVRLV